MMRRQSVLELDYFSRFTTSAEWDLLGHSESVNKQLTIGNWLKSSFSPAVMRSGLSPGRRRTLRVPDRRVW